MLGNVVTSGVKVLVLAVIVGIGTALSSAIAPATSGLVFIMHSAQANAVKVRRGSNWSPDVPIWPTIAIAPGTIIAIDPAGVVSAFSDSAQITASRESTLHYEGSQPLPISMPGVDPDPAVVSAPTYSLWQMDIVAWRLILRCAWCLRVAGSISWVQGATW